MDAFPFIGFSTSVTFNDSIRSINLDDFLFIEVYGAWNGINVTGTKNYEHYHYYDDNNATKDPSAADRVNMSGDYAVATVDGNSTVTMSGYGDLLHVAFNQSTIAQAAPSYQGVDGNGDAIDFGLSDTAIDITLSAPAVGQAGYTGIVSAQDNPIIVGAQQNDAAFSGFNDIQLGILGGSVGIQNVNGQYQDKYDQSLLLSTITTTKDPAGFYATIVASNSSNYAVNSYNSGDIFTVTNEAAGQTLVWNTYSSDGAGNSSCILTDIVQGQYNHGSLLANMASANDSLWAATGDETAILCRLTSGTHQVNLHGQGAEFGFTTPMDADHAPAQLNLSQTLDLNADSFGPITIYSDDPALSSGSLTTSYSSIDENNLQFNISDSATRESISFKLSNSNTAKNFSSASIMNSVSKLNEMISIVSSSPSATFAPQYLHLFDAGTGAQINPTLVARI